MGFSIIYSIKDAKGAVSSTEINVPASVAFADIALFAAAMATLINPLITGVITRIGVAFTLALPAGLRATATAGSDVEEGARFQWRTANGFFAGNRIPTLDESKVVAGTRVIDLADSDVAAFVTAMTSGIDTTAVGGSGTVAPSDSREEDLIALESAVEQFLSSRNR